MFKSDIEKLNIKHITYEEIIATECDPLGVNIEVIFRADLVRQQFPRHTIHLLKNGLNSGDHKSKEHKDGNAIDFYLQGRALHPKKVVYAMIKAGFSGIGVYYNKQTGIYSYHGDIGKVRMWCGHKSKRVQSWKYCDILIDPKQFEV